MSVVKKGYHGSSLLCPHCDRSARFVGWRSKYVVTIFGPVVLWLSYYHCRACGRSQKPWDQALGLSPSGLSPGAAQLVALAGTLTSFAESAEKTLVKMAGLRVSESTVQRVTEATGERLSQLRHDQATFADDQAWQWQRDAQGRSCAYVSLDATGIRQQGENAARAEGRMAYVGMIYNVRSEHDPRRKKPHEVRYLSGFYELNELGRQMRRQAAQVGWDEAEQQIAISDGGAGLEEFFRVHFPLAERILDFWHAKEHLVELAHSLWPDDEMARQKWITAQCHCLKHEGGQAVLTTLEALDVSQRSPAVQEAHRAHTQYYRNHAARMDYPRYVANGWQIGSGPVESACKTVVGNRLKGGGMRWGSDGADAVCHLRALYLSEPGQWEAFWRNHPN